MKKTLLILILFTLKSVSAQKEDEKFVSFGANLIYDSKTKTIKINQLDTLETAPLKPYHLTNLYKTKGKELDRYVLIDDKKNGDFNIFHFNAFPSNIVKNTRYEFKSNIIAYFVENGKLVLTSNCFFRGDYFDKNLTTMECYLTNNKLVNMYKNWDSFSGTPQERYKKMLNIYKSEEYKNQLLYVYKENHNAIIRWLTSRRNSPLREKIIEKVDSYDVYKDGLSLMGRCDEDELSSNGICEHFNTRMIKIENFDDVKQSETHAQLYKRNKALYLISFNWPYNISKKSFKMATKTEYEEEYPYNLDKFDVIDVDKDLVLVGLDKKVEEKSIEYAYGRTQVLTKNYDLLHQTDNSGSLHLLGENKYVHKYDTKDDEKSGIYNTNSDIYNSNKELITSKYHYRYHDKFYNGLLKVRKKSSYWHMSYIDTFGELIIPFKKYGKILNFSNNRAFIKNPGNENYALINENGDILSGYNFNIYQSSVKSLEFRDNIQAIGIKGKEWAIINNEGKVIVKDPESLGTKFYNKIFENIFSFVNQDGLIGFFNNTGIIKKPEYSSVRTFSEGLCAVKKNGKWGFIDKTGSVVIPFNYGSIKNFYKGYSFVSFEKPYDGSLSIPKGFFIDKTGNRKK